MRVVEPKDCCIFIWGASNNIDVKVSLAGRAGAPGSWAGGPERLRPLRSPARLTASASAPSSNLQTGASGFSLASSGPQPREGPAPPPRRGYPLGQLTASRLLRYLRDAALRGPRERRREDGGRHRPGRSLHQVSGRGRLRAPGRAVVTAR